MAGICDDELAMIRTYAQRQRALGTDRFLDFIEAQPGRPAGLGKSGRPRKPIAELSAAKKCTLTPLKRQYFDLCTATEHVWAPTGVGRSLRHIPAVLPSRRYLVRHLEERYSDPCFATTSVEAMGAKSY